MRWLRLLILPLVWALAVPGTGCSEDEPYVRALPPIDEPAFDYGLYCDARGQLVGEDSAVLLVRRPSHLERVYADAQRGEARAQALFRELDDTFVASGLYIADEVTSPRCLALPLPGCKPDWSFLDRLLPSHGPGAQHLREVLGKAFAQRARVRGMRNTLITASVGALLAVTVVKGQLKGAAAAGGTEGREMLAAAEGRTLVVATTEAEVLETRLAEAEATSTEARCPTEPVQLARFRPSLQSPPEGVATEDTLWSDYVAYWERRYAEVTGQGPPSTGTHAPKPPLTWDGYRGMRGDVQRGLKFQSSVGQMLRKELELPEMVRRLLRGMRKPRLDENVGLKRPGSTALTYADQFAVDEATIQPGTKVRVETFSNKSRDFKGWSEEDLFKQVLADAKEAQVKYGGIVQVRRPGHPLFGQDVPVSRVHLVYDSETLTPQLKQRLVRLLRDNNINVEIQFHHVPADP
jgi:hypothetical protein